jgi:hypothetical protein
VGQDGLAAYLYGIVRCAGERVLEDVASIEGGGGPVHLFPHGGLAAIVSETEQRRYETTRAHMLAHQRVLERAMREYPLLPVRFGTVTTAEGESSMPQVKKLLERRAGEFEELLALVQGRAELGLKAFWRDEPGIYQEIVAENGEVRRFVGSLPGGVSRAPYLQQVRLGEMVKECLERKKAAEAERVLSSLKALAYRTVENPVYLDRMVLNAAFLVEASREEEFDGAVKRLEADLGHRLLFKYVGPVPPYNFVNVTVNWHEL